MALVRPSQTSSSTIVFSWCNEYICLNIWNIYINRSRIRYTHERWESWNNVVVVVQCTFCAKISWEKSLFMLVFSRKIYSSSIKCTKIHRQGAKGVIKWRNIKEKVFYLKKNIYFKQSFDDSSMYSTPRYTKCIYLLLFYFLYMHIWICIRCNIEKLTGYKR